MRFEGKHILVGISGGIAAYKTAGMVSHLRQLGAEVRCIMTAHATKLISPITFGELSGYPVATGMFDGITNFDIRHIALASWTDIFVIAPATANIIGKIASGIADDMLSTTAIATTSPILLIPAMNTHMYENVVVQENLKKLKDRGYLLVEPEIGHLACNVTGKGRFPSEDKIFTTIDQVLNGKSRLQGKRVLITAGGTKEKIDPVRYIGNRSSGKMGYAIAQAAIRKKGLVHIISCNPHLKVPVGASVEYVETAEELKQAIDLQYMNYDVVIMAAAVADYKPVKSALQKIKKEELNKLSLALESTSDILLNLGQKKQHQFLVGFAAETTNVIENGKKKLIRKNLDMLIANDVSGTNSGFDVDNNKATILLQNGSMYTYPCIKKEKLGDIIVEHLIENI